MSEQELNSKSFKRAEKSLQSTTNTTFFKLFAHHLLPGYNLNKLPYIKKLDDKNVMELYQQFPYNCDLPRPLLPPAKLSRTVLVEEDPAIQLLTLKNHLKDDIKRLTDHCKRNKQDLDIIYKKDVKWNNKSNRLSSKIPRYVADIAELLEMDPDPYFHGTYNWYYTGGSLNYVRLNSWDVLLFPFMGELVAANIVPREDSIWKPLLQNSAKCKIHGLLYEIRQNTIDDTCRILGRYKNEYVLYTLSNSENQLRLNKIYKQTSSVPYVSVDLSLTNVNYYCTLNAEKVFSLWDINSVKHISSSILKYSKTHDAWGSIRFQQMDPHILVYTDRCCLHYLDIRTSFDRPSLTLCPKFNLENCECLSVDIASKHHSCRYVGTYHSVLMCDNRSPKHCVRQKWTHQFKSNPLFAAVTDSFSDDKEFIVLSTQKAGENKIILNTLINEEMSHSFNLPFTPPYIAETLHASQMEGMCLNPYLRNRFELSNVGNTLVTNGGETFYFVQNSIGDIFYQCITHKNELDTCSLINRKACYALNMWEKALSAQPEPLVPLTFSDKYNMEHIYKSFTNEELCLKYEKDMDDPFELTWKQSLAMLGSYIDILAPELLAVWEIDEEVPIPISATPHQKVLNWLASASLKSVKQTQEESEPEPELYIPTPINTQELISVSQEQDITYVEDSNVLQEMLLPKVITKPIKKKKNA